MTRPTLEIPAPTPAGPSRRLPIHSGPTNRNSDSSASSDFSSNRRTTNTSPSVSPVNPAQSSASRLTQPERTRQMKVEASATPSLPSNATSPYAPPTGQAQPSAQYGGYGYAQPSPYRPAGPSYPQSLPSTPSGPVFKVEAPPYGGYPVPPGLPAGYPVANGQPLYIDNFQPADGERRSKKRRGNLPKWQTDFMRAWYNDHLGNPYPTDDEKHMIMRETGLTLEQVSRLVFFGRPYGSTYPIMQVANWFINCRRRHGPEMTRQAQAESNLRRAHGSTGQTPSHESPTRRREPFTKSEPR